MPNSKQIVYLSQSQYAELIANGSITVNGVTVTYNENDIYVTPQAEPVTDVRVNNVSVAANGVANIPMATDTIPGVVIIDRQNQTGLQFLNGKLQIQPASTSDIKAAWGAYRVLTPERIDYTTFYGLAKASGDTTQSSSSNAVGSYTPEAKGAIQQMLGVSDLIATHENNLTASKAYAIGDVFTANGKLYKATAAIAADAAIITDGANANCEETSIGEGFVKFTDYAAYGKPGIVSTQGTYGTTMYEGHKLGLQTATDGDYKEGYKPYTAVLIGNQHKATFYGLAKAAGDTTQSASSNAVGTYTDNAKASIKSMLGIVDGSTGTVDITGATPTINAVENTRYVCGEVTSLSFTPPSSGISIVRFTSGSTVTVLTIPSTVKFPEWFDPTALETNTIYEICITDGVYGAVMSWAL